MILANTPIIAFDTVLKFHWTKKKKNFSSMKWGLWLRSWPQFLSLERAESLMLYFVLCPTPVWFLWTLPPVLRLSGSTIISFPMPSSPSPQTSFYASKYARYTSVDFPANYYFFHFKLKASQVSNLYLQLHILALSAVLNTLKSNFCFCNFLETSSFILTDQVTTCFQSQLT